MRRSSMQAVVSVASLVLVVRAEEYRTFTDQEGRTIQARVLNFDERSGNVTMQRDDRRTVTVPAAVFSESDRNYIKEWLVAECFRSNAKLRIKAERRKDKAPLSGDECIKFKQPCRYEITCDNCSDQSFNKVSVDYCIYVSDKFVGGSTFLKTVKGAGQIIDLGSHAKKTVVTETVDSKTVYYITHEFSMDQLSGINNSDVKSKTEETEVEGIRIRLSLTSPSGNVFVRELCEPDEIESKYAWDAPSTVPPEKQKKKKKGGN